MIEVLREFWTCSPFSWANNSRRETLYFMSSTRTVWEETTRPRASAKLMQNIDCNFDVKETRVWPYMATITLTVWAPFFVILNINLMLEEKNGIKASYLGKWCFKKSGNSWRRNGGCNGWWGKYCLVVDSTDIWKSAIKWRNQLVMWTFKTLTCYPLLGCKTKEIPGYFVYSRIILFHGFWALSISCLWW